jgi:hypothetical protein
MHFIGDAVAELPHFKMLPKTLFETVKICYIEELVPKLQFLGRQAKFVQQLMKIAVLQPVGRKTARVGSKTIDFGAD